MASSLFRGSKHSNLYSKFRPSPPEEFISSLITYLRDKIHVNNTLTQAVDIGCGTGQSTTILAPYFEKVTGYDVSESQIDCARNERPGLNIEYKVANCEKLPIPDSSVQLITVSQALHWFDTSKLFAEFKRILMPNGVVGVYGHWIPFPKTGNEDKDKKLVHLIEKELHDKQLEEYWLPGRLILQNRYKDISFPFNNVQRLNIVTKTESSLSDYMGYLSSWSAYQELCRENKEKCENLLKDIEKQFLQILESTGPSDEIRFQLHADYFMLMGRH